MKYFMDDVTFNLFIMCLLLFGLRIEINLSHCDTETMTEGQEGREVPLEKVKPESVQVLVLWGQGGSNLLPQVSSSPHSRA